MVTIEPLKERDLEALAALYQELTGDLPPLDRMGRIFSKISSNGDYYLLGAKSESGALAGSIMGIVCYDLLRDCRPFMVMENMIVKSSWRRKGVGRLLLTSLEEIAREMDCIFIQFCSSSFRSESHHFYSSCGYDPGEVLGFRKFLHKETPIKSNFIT